MPRPPYTVADSPAVVARIDRDLARILETVRASDPYLQSLVLTGGFARGEGAVLDGAPQNDYDLVAIRSTGTPRRPYAILRAELEAALGLHIDLATVATWRLPWVGRSIFWYETALRGRVLWGRDLLAHIRARDVDRIHPTEGLRLLVNRGAGLLLATEPGDPHALRLQAAKALLAVLDSRLLALGTFPPSQTERWRQALARRAAGSLPPDLDRLWPWIEWAYTFKVDPERAPPRDPGQAWRAAAQAIVAAVPPALAYARLPSLEAYGRLGGVAEKGRYFWAAGRIPGARRLEAHPTGSVRVATLRLLKDSLAGSVSPQAAATHLGPLAWPGTRPLHVLESLRNATAQ